MPSEVDNLVTVREPEEMKLRPKTRAIKLTAISFAVCFVALFTSAPILSAQFTALDGWMIWAMVFMGAIIIGLLLMSVFLPFLQDMREEQD